MPVAIIEDVTSAAAPIPAGSSGSPERVDFRKVHLRAPAVVILVALFLRIVLLVASHVAEDRFHVALSNVGQEAACVAAALASGKGFANPFRGYEAPTAWLAPVFPLLWSLGYRIFNPETSRGGLYFIQSVNCVFSALTCWPIFWLGKKLFGAKIGGAAAWTWAFLPLAILFPLEWTWDQSLSALLLALVLCATFHLRDAAARSMAWSGYGLLWGFTALVNPTLCLALPFLAAWLAYCRWKTQALPSLRPLLRVALLFVLAILPWTARNYFVLDGFMFIKSNFGLELWLGNNASVPGNDVYAHQLNPMVNHQQLFQLAFAGEPAYMRAKQRAAVAFIRANPGTFVKLFSRRVLDTWTAWYDSHIDTWIATLRLGWAWVAFCAAFSLLAGAGLIVSLRSKFLDALPLALCAILIPIPYYVTHSSLRYRHPIDPVLTLFAVYAVGRVYAAARGKTASDGLRPST